MMWQYGNGMGWGFQMMAFGVSSQGVALWIMPLGVASRGWR